MAQQQQPKPHDAQNLEQAKQGYRNALQAARDADRAMGLALAKFREAEAASAKAANDLTYNRNWLLDAVAKEVK